MKPTSLPAEFRTPFLSLLVLLMMAAYELLLPTERVLWLLIIAATLLGAYLKPATAAALGWVLVLVLGAYLAVNSALAPVTGANWLTLLLIPWLPPFASNLAETARLSQARLKRQEELILAQTNLHPATSLPGLTLAGQFLPILEAHLRRQNHRGLLVEVTIANLDLLRPLSTPEQLSALQASVRDGLRGNLRGSDWLFHIDEPRFLIVADLGRPAVNAVLDEVREIYAGTKFGLPLRPTLSNAGQALVQKLHTAVTPPPQVELQLRSLAFPDPLPPFRDLLDQLEAQPAQVLGSLPVWKEVKSPEEPERPTAARSTPGVLLPAPPQLVNTVLGEGTPSDSAPAEPTGLAALPAKG